MTDPGIPIGLRDGFGRVHDDLRISITDRCNLRCAYCMPEEPEWFPRSEMLSYEEILRLVRILARRGLRKIRLTGGEPLLRRDLPSLIERLVNEPAIEDLSLTTNGVLLDRCAADLRRAGLDRINVSLDTLVPERYVAMTRRDLLDRALQGIRAAVDAGLRPVKVNTVLMRGINDDEVEPLVERAREQGWELRFIEEMPLANGGAWAMRGIVTGDEVRARIHSRWPLLPARQVDPHAPATRYDFADGKGSVGFINSVSAPFCSSCSRLRLTSDGQLRVCLYDDDELDLKTPLRAGATDGELDRMILDRLSRKGRGGALDILEGRAALPLNRTMHQIGG